MKPHATVAVAFASALVDGDFHRAQALLAPALRQQLPPDTLRENLEATFRRYADGAPKRIRFDEEWAHEDWPAKLPGDIGWAYVGIEGDDFVEGITVTVADVEGDYLIREIEWGRP
jgi:hypothetical protein